MNAALTECVTFIEQFVQTKAALALSKLRLAKNLCSPSDKQKKLIAHLTSLKKAAKFTLALVVILLFATVYFKSYLEQNYNDMYAKIITKNSNNKTFLFSTSEVVESPNAEKHSVTVISVYIELNQSKHSVEAYDNWIRNMAVSVKSPWAIVVNKNAYDKIRRLRQNDVTKFYLVEDIWAVLKQLEVERNKSYVDNYLNKQHPMDPERGIHNPNLYALWNLKSYICYKVSQENPFKSKFFIYSDIGAWRERYVPSWPDTSFIGGELVPFLKNRVLFGQIANFGEFNEYHDIIEGTFFAGSTTAMRDLYEHFFAIHDERYAKGMFVGKDQTSMNLLAFKLYNNSVVRLRAKNLNCSFGYDVWFFYQLYLSSRPYDYCNLNRLSILMEPGIK